MSNVTPISKASDKLVDQTPADMLNEAVTSNDALPASACLVVLSRNDGDGMYTETFIAGVNVQEAVGILEAAKLQMMLGDEG